MATVINTLDLPGSATARQFEGYLYDQTNVSFFVTETPPEKGPSLHLHPYIEVFIVLDGQLTITAGDATIEAAAGQIVIVPAETPHKYRNTGTTVARHVDIHTSGQMITTWLEE